MLQKIFYFINKGGYLLITEDDTLRKIEEDVKNIKEVAKPIAKATLKIIKINFSALIITGKLLINFFIRFIYNIIIKFFPI